MTNYSDIAFEDLAALPADLAKALADAGVVVKPVTP